MTFFELQVAEGETGEGGEEDQAFEKLDEEEKRTRFLQVCALYVCTRPLKIASAV